ncbi:hypothetical protein [Flavobacterium akiainvivens]|uniref:hypothetical protein n=1 Tax=Flavobacterium akiainvivens TaxID=1202724 RepID=UPI0008E5EA4E|nr:hypothetical protein [Flavobacterium akiainvivens]SFQ39897.1 hypothetical protein SAMN05444144_1049 [Flavobacterium akiainvivens]
MKLFCLYLIFVTSFIFAQTNPNHVQVKGYTRSDGTYVAPYTRTAPNSTNSDNFSTRGNTNPYTGQPGYVPSDGGTPTYNNNSNYMPSTSTYNTNSYPATSTYNGHNNISNLTTSNYYYDVYEENRKLKQRVRELEDEINGMKESVQFMEEDYNFVMDSIKEAKAIAENSNASQKFENSSENQNTNTSNYSSSKPYSSPVSNNHKDSAWPLVVIIGVIVFLMIVFRK